MQIRQYVSEKKDAVPEEHRRTLLDRVHREEKYIDRLDYLLYSFQRERGD